MSALLTSQGMNLLLFSLLSPFPSVELSCGEENVFVAKMRLTKGVSLQGWSGVDGLPGCPLSCPLLITDPLSALLSLQPRAW